jgi:DNA-binding transcriptional regulator YhcF (GntR family)
MTREPHIESLRRQQRLVFRCVTIFLLDLVGRQIRRHDGDFTRAIVYMAAIQASRTPAGGEGLDAAARAFSVRAIAQSLALPYETTRRKVTDLEAAGLARRNGFRGYTVAPAVFESEARRTDNEATWQALQRVIVDLRALGFDFSQVPGGSTPTPARGQAGNDLVDAVTILTNDFLLRVLEAGSRPHGSMLDASIIATLILANAELLTLDPELAWTYSGAATPPPDHLRTPATITSLAASLGLTHETLRRRMRHYRALGWVKRATGGYLMTLDRLQDPDVLAAGLMIVQRFLQLLQSVSQLGVDLATVGAED